VDRNPSALTLNRLGLAKVQAAADIDSDLMDAIRDGGRGPHGLRGLVERGEESVSGGIFLVPFMTPDLGPNDGPEVIQERLPSMIAKLRRDAGRADDVEEQDGCETTTRSGA